MSAPFYVEEARDSDGWTEVEGRHRFATLDGAKARIAQLTADPDDPDTACSAYRVVQVCWVAP